MSDLDDPNVLALHDKHDMSSFLEDVPKHYEEALRIGEGVDLKPLSKDVKMVVFAGMGGSAIGGSLFKDWSYDRVSVPVEVCRDSVLPKYADRRTLVIAISYSGNTHETLSALLEALRRGCRVVGLSSGGLLGEVCRKHGLTYVAIPSGFQPRSALPYLLVPACMILDRVGLVDGVRKETLDAVRTLNHVREGIKASVPTARNKAKMVALQVRDTVPVIYGFREYASVANRLKTQLNENSKMFSKFEVLPELNHNEIVGWDLVLPPLSKLISVILLRDPEETLDIRTRLEVTKQVIRSKTSNISEIYGQGATRLARMLSAVYTGDYISYYLAVLRGVNPTPVDTVVFFKKEVEGRLRFLEKLEGELLSG